METAGEARIIEELKEALEEMAGTKIKTPLHFERLRQMVFERTGQYLSSTTLKRMWGYINEPLTPRVSTLNILSQAMGYKDWENFVAVRETTSGEEGLSSSSKLVRHIDVPKDLEAGQHVTLYWYPGRECEVKYLGNLSFEVVETRETHLRKGDRFDCHLILEGQPLYLSNLRREDSSPVTYICGKLHGGIRFKIHPL